MKMKKFTAVILALVMIFAMSANAFAAGNSTTSVEIQMYGEEAYTVSVTDQDISSRCGSESHLYEVPTYVTDALTSYTAADALIAAYMMTYNINDASTIGADTIDYACVDVEVPGVPGPVVGVVGGAILGVAGADQVVLTSVGREAFVGGKIQAIMRGLVFLRNVIPGFAEEYSSEYDLSNVSSIRFDYNTVTSETFETTTPISGALSAPNN